IACSRSRARSPTSTAPKPSVASTSPRRSPIASWATASPRRLRESWELRGTMWSAGVARWILPCEAGEGGRRGGGGGGGARASGPPLWADGHLHHKGKIGSVDAALLSATSAIGDRLR